MINANELFEQLGADQSYEGKYMIDKKSDEKRMLLIRNLETDDTFGMKMSTYYQGVKSGTYVMHKDGSYTKVGEKNALDEIVWDD